jgi:putative peptidoglycan lipid II flippase
VAAAAGLLAVVTIAARVVGFARWLVFSGTVGTTCLGTTYTTANTVPNVLYEVVAGGALAAVTVPLVAAAVAEGALADARAVVRGLLGWALTATGLLAVVIAVLADPIASWLLPAATFGCADNAGTGATMLRIFAPQVVLYGLAVVCSGVLAAYHRFIAAAVAPLLSSLVVIASYLLFAQLAPDPAQASGTAIAVLAGGTTLGVVVLSLPLAVAARRLGVDLRPTWSVPPGMAVRARRLAAAGGVALVAQQLAVLAAVVAGNRSGPGVLPAWGYAQSIYLLPYAVLSVPVATTVFPVIAGRPVEPAHATTALAHGLRAVTALGALGAALVAATAGAVGQVFAAIDVGGARGPHGAASAALAALPGTLTLLAPSVLGLSVVLLAGRALAVRGRTRDLAMRSALGWIIAAGVPLLAVRNADPAGRTLALLGAALSVGVCGAGALLMVAVRRAWTSAALAGWPRTAAASAVGGVVAAVLGRASAAAVGSFAGSQGSWSAVLGGLVSSLVAVVVFTAVLRLADPAGVAAARSVLRPGRGAGVP